MAQVERKRTLVNPAKRKRRNGAKKKMSAKQIAHFGTKRQKAALKASRTRKRAKPARRHAPARRNAAAKPRAARRRARGTAHRRRTAKRSNPGGIVEVALNPAQPKRRKTVARSRKRKSSTTRRRVHRHRKNPAPVARRTRRRSASRKSSRRKGARRNPSMGGGITNLITSAAYAIGGAVGSKYLTQMVLGSSNQGYLGYAANLAASFVGGKALGMFVRNKQAENSFILGGVIMTLVRLLSDQTPLGASLQQYGFGDYEASTWVSPARYVNAATSAQVDIPTALRPLPAAAARPGMAGVARAGMGATGTYGRGRSTY